MQHGRIFAAFAAAGAMVLSVTQPAVASTPADETIAAIESASESIEATSGVAPLEEALPGAVSGDVVTLDAGASQVVVDTEASTITLGDGEASLGIVIADAERPAEVSSQGFAVAETGVEATTAVLPQEDAVQLLTVIDGPAAPSTFSYDLNVPEGAAVALDEASEGVIVADSEGALIAGIAPAWAVDAAGMELSTHFEVEGTTVIQVVDHATDGVQYPVTADPYLGTNLFSYVRTDAALTVASMRLSTWGMTVWIRGGKSTTLLPTPIAIFQGQAIINQYGWSEMLGRMGANAKRMFNRTSVQQQFSCHALGWIADYRAWEWNLERDRPALSVHWANNVLQHRCNWNRSNGGV
ncbi:hypothetical protein GCM10009846_08070 [Agrococcus versicolor]|uniref:DUF2599 domain-containing protein n=2 Tax=Agrococcus versicolor TaxID=501482 RepID=A0ABP5MBF5_9MICO